MRNSWPLGALARNSGRIVLTVAGIARIAGPIAADWNESHFFNQGWP